MKNLFLTVVLATGFMTGISRAELLVYEGFDYNDGAYINGLNGGTGWTEAWVSTSYADRNNIRSDAAMTYTDALSNELPTEGLGYRVDRNFRNGSRNFPQTYTEGVYWFSFLSRTTPVADGVNNRAGMGFSGKMTVSNVIDVDDNNLYRLSVLGQEDFTSVSGQEGNVHFFLVRYEIGTATDDGQAHLWIDPLLNAEPGLGSADAALTGLDSTQMLFSQLSRLDTPTNNGPRNYYDEVRLATDFGHAVGIPEPASLTLLGLGIVMVLLRRRLRSSRG